MGMMDDWMIGTLESQKNTPSLHGLTVQFRKVNYSGLHARGRVMTMILFAFFAILFLTPSTAQACTNPTGTEGTIIYNQDHKVAQFCNGTDWIGMAGGRSSAAGDSMVAGWPDAIRCTFTTPNWGQVILPLKYADFPGDNRYYYRSMEGAGSGSIYVGTYYDNAGAFAAHEYITSGGAQTVATSDCNGKSISQLYSDGQAFNFIGGQGDNSGASVTEALKLEDADNNTIIQVEESSDENKIRFDTAGTERMIIDENGNVGIGTGTPQNPLHVIGNGGTMNLEGTDHTYIQFYPDTYAGGRKAYLGFGDGANNHFHLGNNESDGDIIFANNGGGRLYIKPSGNVGIGTITPSDGSGSGGQALKLDVAGAVGATHYCDADGLNCTAAAALGGGSSVWTTGSGNAYRTTGNVGIGTSSPALNLHVANSAADSNVWMATENDAQQWLVGVRGDNSDTFQIVDNTGGTDTRLAITPDGNVGIGTPTPADKLHVSGGGFVSSNTGAGGNPNFIARAHPTADQGEIGTTTAHPQTFITSSTERMRIDASGNVGIGTPTPLSKLHLYSTDNALNYLDIQNVSTTDSAGSILRLITTDAADTGTSVANLVKYNSGGFIINNSETDAAAYIGLNLGGSARMRITSSGNVGIGTTSPSAPLQLGDSIFFHEGGGVTATGPDIRFDSAGLVAAGDSMIFMIDGDNDSSSNAFVIRKDGTSTASGTELFRVNEEGNVGIGTDAPTVPLHVVGGVDATLSGGTGYMLIGNESGGNIVIDTNEILARNNGSDSALFLQGSGSTGIVAIGNSVGTTYKLEVGDSSSSYIARFTNTNTASGTDGIIVRTGPTSNPSSGSHFVRFQDGDGDNIGSIRGNSSGGVDYNTTSDRRIKRNIVDTQFTLDDLMRVQVRDYNPLGSDKHVTGYIAQELHEVIPNVVNQGETEDEMWNVAYGRVTPFIVKAVQDLKHEKDAEIKALKEQNETLKASLADLGASDDNTPQLPSWLLIVIGLQGVAILGLIVIVLRRRG